MPEESFGLFVVSFKHLAQSLLRAVNGNGKVVGEFLNMDWLLFAGQDCGNVNHLVSAGFQPTADVLENHLHGGWFLDELFELEDFLTGIIFNYARDLEVLAVDQNFHLITLKDK